MLLTIVSFTSFLSGIVLGCFLTFAVIFHFLSNKPIDPAKYEKDCAATKDKDQLEQLQLKEDDLKDLNRIISFLEDYNSPFKNVSAYLQKLHNVGGEDPITFESKMKTIIDATMISKMEKDLQDQIADLKDHNKQIKVFSGFFTDLSKVFSSFSKDLSKLSSSTKSNMNKSLSFEHKEEMIVNNWWQALHVSIEHLAADQEDVAVTLSEQLSTFLSHSIEELNLIEKKLSSEGGKQLSSIRDNISSFETKKRDRDKMKEKVKQSATGLISGISSNDGHNKRLMKLQQSEEQLNAQVKKLYEVQKDFYRIMPRISSDIQLSVLKSIVETHSQLVKWGDCLDKSLNKGHVVTKRMRAQLTNAAASLVQMIREEYNAVGFNAGTMEGTGGAVPLWNSTADNALRAKMMDYGVQGYEWNLQQVLEGLMAHAAGTKDRTLTGSPVPLVSPKSNGSGKNEFFGGEDQGLMASQGKMDMFKESSACLAASNPALLPELPPQF